MAKKNTAPAARNPMAGSLAHGAFQHRVIRARKGKGAYNRKPKHPARAFG